MRDETHDGSRCIVRSIIIYRAEYLVASSINTLVLNT